MHPSKIPDRKRDDTSLDDSFLQVQKGKAKNAGQKLSLSTETRRVLKYRMQPIEGKRFFRGMQVVKLDQLYIKTLKALNIKSFTDEYFALYSLRRCFAPRHTENQNAPLTLSEPLGHGDLKMLKCYAH